MIISKAVDSNAAGASAAAGVTSAALAAANASANAAAGSGSGTSTGALAGASGSGSTIAGAATATATTSTTEANAARQTAAQQSDRFLKLLVAQMRNQDPLNPLDNAAVTSQMAQISTVEGIEKLNTTMATFASSGNGLSSLQGASLIGRKVLVKGDAIDLGAPAVDGSRPAAQGGFELSSDAANATIEILDAGGSVIASQQQTGLSAGVHRFDWDGTTSSGARAAAGTYTFRVNTGSAGAQIPATTLQARPVAAVINGTDGPRLDIGGNSQLTIADVRAIL